MDIYAAAQDVSDLVWVIGWSREPVTTNPRLLAKLGEVVDTTGLDTEAVVQRLDALGIAGVITFSDPPLQLAAVIAGRLGLIGHSEPTAEMLSDKMLQRAALRAGGVPVPGFMTIPEVIVDVQRFVMDLEIALPAVLKPRRGAASRDAVLVRDAAALADQLKAQRTEPFILEEFLEDRSGGGPKLGAKMVSVESVARSGEIHHLIITGRFPLAPPFRETGSYMPSDIDPADVEGVLAMATEAALALGVTDGILHTEVKLTPAGPRIIEVNGRLGGGVSAMMTRVGGPIMSETAVRVALGLEVDTDWLGDRPAVSFFRFVHGPNRKARVIDVTGLAEVGQLPGIEAVRLNKPPGSDIDPVDGNLHHIVALEGVVGSHKELAELLAAVDSHLRIEVE
jgi:biotin carboxylase